MTVTVTETLGGFAIQRHDSSVRSDRFYSVRDNTGRIVKTFRHIANARKYARRYPTLNPVNVPSALDYIAAWHVV